MPQTRKNHSPGLKAKVAVEAIESHKTAAQIAQMFGVHPTQVGSWKKQALAGLPDVFGNGREQGSPSHGGPAVPRHSALRPCTRRGRRRSQGWNPSGYSPTVVVVIRPELGPQHRLLVDEHHHMEQQPPHRYEQNDRGRSLQEAKT